jgi:hypothetical protein
MHFGPVNEPTIFIIIPAAISKASRRYRSWQCCYC